MNVVPIGPIQMQVSAISEWEMLMRGIGDLAEQAVDATARPDRLWQVNQLEGLILATEHGQKVGDSGYTREAALAARKFVLNFLVWANTPIEVDQFPDGSYLTLTPMAIISARTTN